MKLPRSQQASEEGLRQASNCRTEKDGMMLGTTLVHCGDVMLAGSGAKNASARKEGCKEQRHGDAEPGMKTGAHENS